MYSMSYICTCHNSHIYTQIHTHTHFKICKKTKHCHHTVLTPRSRAITSGGSTRSLSCVQKLQQVTQSSSGTNKQKETKGTKSDLAVVTGDLLHNRG